MTHPEGPPLRTSFFATPPGGIRLAHHRLLRRKHPKTPGRSENTPTVRSLWTDRRRLSVRCHHCGQEGRRVSGLGQARIGGARCGATRKGEGWMAAVWWVPVSQVDASRLVRERKQATFGGDQKDLETQSQPETVLDVSPGKMTGTTIYFWFGTGWTPSTSPVPSVRCFFHPRSTELSTEFLAPNGSEVFWGRWLPGSVEGGAIDQVVVQVTVHGSEDTPCSTAGSGRSGVPARPETHCFESWLITW